MTASAVPPASRLHPLIDDHSDRKSAIVRNADHGDPAGRLLGQRVPQESGHESVRHIGIIQAGELGAGLAKEPGHRGRCSSRPAARVRSGEERLQRLERIAPDRARQFRRVAAEPAVNGARLLLRVALVRRPGHVLAAGHARPVELEHERPVGPQLRPRVGVLSEAVDVRRCVPPVSVQVDGDLHPAFIGPGELHVGPGALDRVLQGDLPVHDVATRRTNAEIGGVPSVTGSRS